MFQEYTPEQWNAREQAFKRLARSLTIESLNLVWLDICDQAVEAGQLDWVADAYIPIAEYHIDGIDEQADDEEQTTLKNIIAASYYDVSTALTRLIAERARGDAA